MAMLAFVGRALRLARPYWLRLALGVVCGFAAGLTHPLLMASIKLVVEVVFPQGGAGTVTQQLSSAPAPVRALLERASSWLHPGAVEGSTVLLVCVVGLVPLSMLLRGLFMYLNVYLMNWVSARTIADLRIRLFDHLLGLSAGFFGRTSTGELMARFNEVYALQPTISQALVVLVREPVTVVSLAALLLVQQPKLTLVTLALFPFTLLPFIVYRHKVRRSSVGIYQKQAALNKLLHETLTGYRIVKAYNLEDQRREQFRQASRAAVSYYMRVLRSTELPGPLIEFLGSLGVAGFFLYIALSPKPETPADLLQFVGCIFLMYQPIKGLIRLHSQLTQAQAATQPVFNILATQSTVKEPEHPVPLQAAGADIVFENVSFSYGDRQVLRNINLTVPAGKMVALVGSSGAGKTTLASLLLRFYDPQQGCIRIGGVDIRNVSTRDLRSQIAVVTQDTILFNDTIRANIAVGKPGATDQEIVAAAKHAHAHEFIMERSQGYDTVIGEKGVHLSGGQRQRIAIARAILKNAPILILDEATNALDSESERAVQAALEELMQGRTTICIAHRLSTIQKADLIVVLNQGQIVEMDTHQDLIARRGHYHKLYQLQAQ
jgi:subfamily B ATP-binding cassette protein MsbA